MCILYGVSLILGIRECLIPRPGYVFAFADYDGLELRTMAQACLSVIGHSKLAEALNAGIDPHCSVASEILAWPYETVRGIYKDKRHAEYHNVYKKRQMGKVANFGFPGGLGIKRTIEYAAQPKYGVTLTEQDAKDLKQNWLNSWPEFREYFNWINSLMVGGETGRATGNVTQLFSGRLRGGVPFTECANTVFQGLGGDATKAAGYALTRECRIGNGPLRGGHPIVYVHDEFWCEVRREVAHEAAEQMAQIMCDAARVFLPDVPPKAEPGLSERWSKSAERIVGEDGRLVPWDG